MPCKSYQHLIDASFPSLTRQAERCVQKTLYIPQAFIRLMNDPRLLPMDKREPVEEYDDVFLEADEEAYETFPLRIKTRVKENATFTFAS